MTSPALPAGAQCGHRSKASIDVCPCLTATGDRWHVFSLGHGHPTMSVSLQGQHTWSTLPVDRSLLGVERGRLQGFPESIARVDGRSTLAFGNAISVPVLGTVLARELGALLAGMSTPLPLPLSVSVPGPVFAPSSAACASAHPPAPGRPASAASGQSGGDSTPKDCAVPRQVPAPKRAQANAPRKGAHGRPLSPGDPLASSPTADAAPAAESRKRNFRSLAGAATAMSRQNQSRRCSPDSRGEGAQVVARASFGIGRAACAGASAGAGAEAGASSAAAHSSSGGDVARSSASVSVSEVAKVSASPAKESARAGRVFVPHPQRKYRSQNQD